MSEKELSGASIARMPVYLRCLQKKLSDGKRFVSSTELASDALVSAVLVRKDLEKVSSLKGKPRIGFDVQRLITDIEKFLGYDNLTDAVIVGAGGLGRAFLSYEGFKQNGLNLVAGFDIDEKIVGTSVAGKPVYPVAELSSFVEREHIRIGIITAPKSAAQEILDSMVAAGIKGVWNFAPVRLFAPKSVVIKNEDLSASFALLVSGLYRREE